MGDLLRLLIKERDKLREELKKRQEDFETVKNLPVSDNKRLKETYQEKQLSFAQDSLRDTERAISILRKTNNSNI